MTAFLVLAAAYLLGAVPFGYLLVRLRSGRDVRTLGSGNIGATNVLRTSGRAMGVFTLALDIGKGIVAVWLADRYFDELDAPIKRLNGLHTPTPYSPPLEAAVVPNSAQVLQAIRDLLAE